MSATEPAVDPATAAAATAASFTTITVIPERGTDLGPKTINLAKVNNSLTVGRLLEGQDPNAPNTLRFDSKVVSRSHCRITIREDKRFYIQDTRSSGGTMLNGKQLAPKGKESGLFLLNDDALVQLGEDVVAKDGPSATKVTHAAVVFRVKVPPPPPVSESPTVAATGAHTNPTEDISQTTTTIDAALAGNYMQLNIDNEFRAIWNFLIADLHVPMRRLKTFGQAASAPAPFSEQSTDNSVISTNTISSGSPTTMSINTFSQHPVTSPATLVGSPNTSVPPSATNTLSNGLPPSPTFENANTQSTLTYSPLSTTQNEIGTIPEEFTQEGTSWIKNGYMSATPQTYGHVIEFEASLMLISKISWENTSARDQVLQLLMGRDARMIDFYRKLKDQPDSFKAVALKYLHVQQ